MNQYKIVVKFYNGRIDVKIFNTHQSAEKFFNWSFERKKVKSVTFYSPFGGEWSLIKSN